MDYAHKAVSRGITSTLPHCSGSDTLACELVDLYCIEVWRNSETRHVLCRAGFFAATVWNFQSRCGDSDLCDVRRLHGNAWLS